jgi:hypothetical protein
MFQLGSDGSDGVWLPAFTNRWLSTNRNCRSVFVTAFLVLPTLYHVHLEKSNDFLGKNHIFAISQILPRPAVKKYTN